MQKVLKPGLILIAGLILVIRPVSVFLSMIFSKKTNYAERTFLAFLAPRGIVAAAVSSVFALEFEHAAEDGRLPHILADQAHDLVPLIFMCIIGTVLFYSFTALPLAKKLKVTTGRTDGILFPGAEEWVIEIASVLQAEGHNVFLVDTKYEKIAEAKLAGLPALRANILSEYAEHVVDLGGIGQLVAMTPNDEINSLAGLEYIHTFGRKNVWQIAPQDGRGHYTKAVSSEKRVRICFGGAPTFKEMNAIFAQPHVIKKTTLTEVFTLDHFYEQYGEQALILFISDAKNGLRPVEGDLTKVSEETTIYALIPDLEPSASTRELDQSPMGL